MSADRPEASPSRHGLALAVLSALFVAGAATLVYALRSNALQPDLKFLTVSFLFLMGISQAGVVFCAILRLVKAEWGKPYYRLAQLSTMAFFPFAIVGFLVIYYYARQEMFYWLDPGPDAHLSPWLSDGGLFWRNLFAMLLFYALAGYYVAKGLGPDLAGRKGRFSRWLSSRTGEDHRKLEGELYLLSPVVILVFVVCNTFFAWDFAMMLIPHWHSTVFPIYFWFGNLFAGSAAMIAFPALIGVSDTPGARFRTDHIRKLGMLVTAFTLMWLYFFWAQFFVMWFGNMPHETTPLWRQMYGHYGPFFWTMMTGCFFLPFAAFIFARVKRSLLLLGLVCVAINLGIWLNKYLMVMPVYAPDHTPFQSWLDVGLTLGLVAGFLALLLWLATRLPMYADWELKLKPIPRV